MKPTAEDIIEFVKLYPALPMHLFANVVGKKFPATKQQYLTIALNNLARAGRIVRITHTPINSTIENHLYVPVDSMVVVSIGDKSTCPYDGVSML